MEGIFMIHGITIMDTAGDTGMIITIVTGITGRGISAEEAIMPIRTSETAMWIRSFSAIQREETAVIFKPVLYTAKMMQPAQDIPASTIRPRNLEAKKSA